jgi:uncharacterized membrane protein YeaQ/YmgE (transglycosylase-associated protein family)
MRLLRVGLNLYLKPAADAVAWTNNRWATIGVMPPLCGEPIPIAEIDPAQSLDKEKVMHLSSQSLLVILFVGIIAGWLAGRVMEGGGFGLIGDLLVGLIGAFIGDWLLPKLGIHLGVGMVALILNAFIGAVVLLLILRLINGGFGYRRRAW